jgi:hypothetical protein
MRQSTSADCTVSVLTAPNAPIGAIQAQYRPPFNRFRADRRGTELPCSLALFPPAGERHASAAAH